MKISLSKDIIFNYFFLNIIKKKKSLSNLENVENSLFVFFFWKFFVFEREERGVGFI